MSPVFIITLVLLAAIAYTIYRKQRRHFSDSDYELRPAPQRTLFPERDTDEHEQHALPAHQEESATNSRAALLERAARGDLSVLVDARRHGDNVLYGDALDELVSWAGVSRERLDALAEFICADESLRGSVALSRSYSRILEDAPDAATTARALHLAASSDDADEFSRAMETTVGLWREGKMPALSAEDLRGLIESEFWVLSAQARASGAAFVLKQKIAALRDELSAARLKS